jgi:hypothetical protein
MATQNVPRLAPGFAQPGQTSQRLAGMFFLNTNGPTGFNIPELAGLLPLNIGATTLNTSPIMVAGYNTFMALLDAITANITFKVNHISPLDQTTILLTRTIATVTAGTGLNILNFGFGNALAQAGVDVFYFISLGFTGAGANATINQFPGLWGCVR